MADRKTHKYIRKVPTKNGKYRYIYANTGTLRDFKIKKTGEDLINSVKRHVSDDFHKKFTENVKEKAERQQAQRKEIIDNGKRFIDAFLEPLPEYR